MREILKEGAGRAQDGSLKNTDLQRSGREGDRSVRRRHRDVAASQTSGDGVGQMPLGGEDETRDVFAGFGSIGTVSDLDRTTLRRLVGQKPC